LKTARPLSPRASIARIVARVAWDGALLDPALDAARTQLEDPRDQGFVQECAYGVLRHFHGLRHRLSTLLARPLRKRDAEIEALLLSGLYQLFELETPAHAVVDASAQACRELDRAWATSLVNASLRNALRRHADYIAPTSADPEAYWQHPRWLIDAIAQAWPADWQRILTAHSARPPLALRVNRRRGSRADYLARLAQAGIAAAPIEHCPEGIVLDTPLPVSRLPDFAQGAVSVQDGGAQLAATLLDARPGQRVLDACAAPGGKAMHLLETVDALRLLALDVDAARLARVIDNAQRLGLDCATRVGDAANPAAWWDGEPFDRILIDAPCSATGVIRRHPDIKLHREPGDLAQLSARQAAIVDALWPLLAPGGKLVYATCSILPQENDAVIDAALQRHPAAAADIPLLPWGRATRHGRQVLPGDDGMDGFYYCVIGKSAHA